jgi:wyosine [tRNA(Phe)-imidazoG37] synthetase (radical SAM superfamily)
MFDINFYMKTYFLQEEINKGRRLTRKDVSEILESFRDRNPHVYNIETTNACNMRCKMCPRTTMMTRDIETIDRDTFRKIIDQIEPFTAEKWNEWKSFCQRVYGIPENDMSENHFFLYIIPQIIQLHGYGDPLLDKNMPEYILMLTKRKMLSYFSCNPANINMKKTLQMFENGLNYIKYSIESVDDAAHKQIRGNASGFTQSYKKILQLLDMKAREGFETTVIITMLDLNRVAQADEFEKLRKAFDGLDVYLYLKSEDTQWYRKDFHGTHSIHWSEFCKHPWMSMTIKSNGEAAMCMEDFNNEIVLGDAGQETLFDIWNGEKYRRLRLDHIHHTKNIRCSARCDMKLIGEYLDN